MTDQLLHLRPPTLADKAQFLAFADAFAERNLGLHGVYFELFDSFEAWLDFYHAPAGTPAPDGSFIKIDESCFFAFDKTNRLVGVISIRHALNEFLLREGGHIGYSTHPEFWGGGIASTMLQFALQYCPKIGLDKVLICCDERNLASARVIEKNGGVLENTVRTPTRTMRRYWVVV
ncbi:GNAT family N-acetyltransferase [Moraxella caviae]|uniref:GNAT family N-acetyltransferase n=1 Tax=Moraxella caviae TaxID=34060 RepID=A0A1T0A2E7_9GAMM|nr:GNAT family N-acetyltransferase [Moraxella caviae]OOR89920.1 GNAT family N-acetyltransferase [Moraxella caviae]STZ14303.1 TDP-fucosamine acetyltransferase [Moraxella caviae]VEW12242.1 TDP-fucosamine acetyltransferase [Moraxella caviae]